MTDQEIYTRKSDGKELIEIYRADTFGDAIIVTLEEHKPKKIIDLSCVVNSPVLMLFKDELDEQPLEGYLIKILDKHPHPYRFNNDNTRLCQFNPDTWVYNHDGKCHWPEGVQVELIFRGADGNNKVTVNAPKERWDSKVFRDGDIIASRFVDKLEGWQYEWEIEE